MNKEQLIPGEIYFHNTGYEWFIVFDNYTETHIYGSYYIECKNNKLVNPSKKYANPHYNTKGFRSVSLDERNQVIKKIQSVYPNYMYLPQNNPTYEIY